MINNAGILECWNTGIRDSAGIKDNAGIRDNTGMLECWDLKDRGRGETEVGSQRVRNEEDQRF